MLTLRQRPPAIGPPQQVSPSSGHHAARMRDFGECLWQLKRAALAQAMMGQAMLMRVFLPAHPWVQLTSHHAQLPLEAVHLWQTD